METSDNESLPMLTETLTFAVTPLRTNKTVLKYA
jgi:hypothetical protein